jgi:predicted amidohydrolase
MFLNSARAIENQCYLLASAQYGEHNEKRKRYDDSIGSIPDNDLATPSIIVCDIDDGKLKTTRERMPIRMHRQNCQYSW